MKRVMFGSVIVRGLPALIWATNNGITEPREAITLPYRVAHSSVSLDDRLRDLATMTFSISALVWPMALIGYTALSVLSTTTFSTRLATAALMTFSVPRILVLTASSG